MCLIDCTFGYYFIDYVGLIAVIVCMLFVSVLFVSLAGFLTFIYLTIPVGPCALEYTRMKTPDHYWTDPPADELLQRHRIHSIGGYHIPSHSESPKRPGLQVPVIILASTCFLMLQKFSSENHLQVEMS